MARSNGPASLVHTVTPSRLITIRDRSLRLRRVTDDMVLYPDRGKWLKTAAISAAAVVFGVVCVATGKHVVLGITSILFGGLGVAVGWGASRPGSGYLRLGQDQLEYRNMFSRPHALAWAKVEHFAPVSNAVTGRAQFVGWSLRSEFAAERRGTKVAKALAGVHGQLPDTYGLSPAALATLLNEHLKVHLAGDSV